MKPSEVPFLRGEGFGTLGTNFEQPSLPEAVSLAPATWGAWLSWLAIALLLGFAAFWLARRHQRRAPRRQAVRELAALCARSASSPGPALNRLQVVLKSCALASFERRRVASLSGPRWLAFLNETAPGAGFAGPAGETLLRLSERGPDAVTPGEFEPLFAAAQAWVRRHHGRI